MTLTNIDLSTILLLTAHDIYTDFMSLSAFVLQYSNVKADYRHLLPLKNSSNLFKGPRSAPPGPPRSPVTSGRSSEVRHLRTMADSDRQKHKAFRDKCVKMSPSRPCPSCCDIFKLDSSEGFI